MISFCVKSKHDFFKKNRIEEFTVEINNILVNFRGEADMLIISMQGNVSLLVIEDLWADIFSIIFIYLGTYPKIISMLENNKYRDFSYLVHKYNSWEYMSKEYMGLCNINADTINQEIINRYRKLNVLAIYSLEYLVSDVYKKVILNHRLTLLLHVIDGVITDDEMKEAKNEIMARENLKRKIGDYQAKVHYLCEKQFFCYDREFSSELLCLLDTTESKFVDSISDTRNLYSHFLEKSKKPDCLSNGREMLEYFEIVFFSLRLQLLKRLEVIAEKERIKEYLYILHDWISELYNKDVLVKSNHYKIMRSISEMNDRLKIADKS